MKGMVKVVKHIILWDHAEGFTSKEKKQNAVHIKSSLEALKEIVPGILELIVYSNLLDSGNADIVLYSVFENREALERYKAHPEHIKTATEVVRPCVKNRRCADFEIS